jgi:6,7-dimethyl-8-ribityllumazine synthase
MAEISNSGLLQNKEGIRQLKGALVVLIKTEWNQSLVGMLEEGCLKTLRSAGVKTQVVVVPGAVEIPFAIAQYWNTSRKKNRPEAFIALGCVIRGGTPHFEYVCQSVTNGITQLNVTLPVPTIFGVLTVDNEKQALERTGGIHGHKGEEAAVTALKMILLSRQLNNKE